MTNPEIFALNRPGYSAKLLNPGDAVVLQRLYEQCTEFALLTDGHPPALTAAREEFDVVPGGKTTQDKYIFGLFAPQNDLIGMIESIRYYPDNQTWWLGLMMLSPEHRGQGLGKEFYRAFENWVAAQGLKQMSLSVIEANDSGLQFWKGLGFEILRKTEPRQFGNKTHAVYVMSRAVATTA
ncbi:GNAT family N-acetyltransferase [Synechococcus elongatus IITB7]|uniref:GNAT family N-acetyltransferase n=1 Tax=Synechococcus elongatus TaxID=32046 RepID=UPI0030D04955